ncbi:MAG TPA: 2-amino-4-hydroxy-6-hydroxymethyldihydropteridine diphosphokinase [Gemmatimonadaceae bacterium]|nr:2-amino-4-hydroxy-6-hydroxymethyldihydropteridine diphosphokinase [Gemmatimonadaceae bacterium]
MSDLVYIALGSNLGDREATLDRARKEIARIESTRIVAESDIEETAPIGPVKQDFFLNQMIAVETDLQPRALLDALQKIEKEAGRERAVRWGPRTLDLDIVMIDGREHSDDALVVPHPQLPNRDFWLRELEQIKTALHV